VSSTNENPNKLEKKLKESERESEVGSLFAYRKKVMILILG
jgi:hypothetical protein